MIHTSTLARYNSFVSRHFPVALKSFLNALAVGALIGLAAWNNYSVPIAAILLPIFVPLAKTRLGVFALAFGYHSAAIRPLIGFTANWFEGSLLIGTLSWLALSTIAALPWLLCMELAKSRKPLPAATCAVMAFVVALLPPFASFVPGHPLIGWGFIVQGWGFVGVAVALVTTLALAYWVALKKLKAVRPLYLLLVGMTCLGIAIKPSIVDKGFDDGAQVVAVDTEYGAPPTDDTEKVDRILQVGSSLHANARAHQQARVLLYPETTLGRLDEVFDFSVNANIRVVSEIASKTIVVGQERREKGVLVNLATAYFPNGSVANVQQRHPAMLSMWRPWDENNHFPLNYLGDGILDLAEAGKARVLICYEEFIPLLYLLDEFRGGHDYVLVMANNWSAESALFPYIQSMHSLSMFKLFDREFYRAVNFSPYLSE